MTILVTGGAGYVGSVTVELLRTRGERVVVLDNLSRGHRAAVADDAPFYRGNVGDQACVAHIVREHDVEAGIHFAAFAYVGESVADPARYFHNNVAQSLGLYGRSSRLPDASPTGRSSTASFRHAQATRRCSLPRPSRRRPCWGGARRTRAWTT